LEAMINEEDTRMGLYPAHYKENVHP